MFFKKGFLPLLALCVSFQISAFGQSQCNRDPNWDWTQDLTYTYYVQESSQSWSSRLPYHTGAGPAGKIEINDIQPQDGWVLVYRDFGEPSCPTVMPMFILYNKYRGTMRLFYMNTITNSTYTYAVGRLTQTSSTNADALFPFGKTDYFLNSFDKNAIESNIHKTAPEQWSVAEFNVVGYDNNLHTNATFIFEIYGVNISDIDLGGDINLQQVLSNEGSVGSKLSLGNVTNAVQKGYKWYNDVNKAKDEIEDFSDANPNKWYSSTLNSVVTAGLTAVAPYLGAAAGVISSFISGSKSSQTMPMKFKGSLELSGEISNESLLYYFEMRVPGAPLTNPNDPRRPDYTQPLGIFNVVNKPTFNYKLGVYCSLVDNLNSLSGYEGDDSYLWEVYGPEMLALQEGELSKEEETEIIDFIVEDLLAQQDAAQFGGGTTGPGGTTCEDVFFYKLTSPLQVITNPVLSGKVSYTCGIVFNNRTTLYYSPSYYTTSGGVRIELSGPTQTIALKVRVNTGVSGAAPVYILNTYDFNRYYNNNL